MLHCLTFEKIFDAPKLKGLFFLTKRFWGRIQINCIVGKEVNDDSIIYRKFFALQTKGEFNMQLTKKIMAYLMAVMLILMTATVTAEENVSVDWGKGVIRVKG